MFFSLAVSILILNSYFRDCVIYKCRIKVKVDIFRKVNIS